MTIKITSPYATAIERNRECTSVDNKNLIIPEVTFNQITKLINDNKY